MKKLKYFVFVLFILLVSGCAEIELPPEGSKCSWYINDTYENANWLFYAMEGMINLDENPSVNFWYNSTSDYGVNFTGLKSDVDVDIYDNISGNGTYEITLCNDSGCARLSFNFDSQNIKQSSGGGNCPYPTLYYDLSSAAEAIQTFYFSTGYSSNDFAFINIFNSKVDSTDPDESVDPDVEEPNWCSTFYRIEDQTFNNDANLILYFWQKEDGLYYAVKKIDGDIELTNENVGQYSEFSTSYSWQSVKDELTYYDEVNSTTFTLTEFSNMENMVSYDEDKLICPDGYTQQSTSGATTGDYDGQELVIITGEEFKRRLRELEPYIKNLADYKGISVLGKLPVQINGTDTNFAWFGVNDSLSNIEDVQLEYLTEQKISNVLDYCNSFYDDADKNKNKQNYDLRMEECISFNDMIKEAVQLGLIRDLSGNCDILSNELIEKLQWFLDIVKIAGPLLAIGLGTLDFIKTVASGDADKEMQNTFKKFRTRIIAAVLLFLVPFVLAFLMDLFLGNQVGYDSDNPFCGVVEWEDYNEN